MTDTTNGTIVASEADAASAAIWANSSLTITLFLYAMAFESMVVGLRRAFKTLRSKNESRFIPAVIMIYNLSGMSSTLAVVILLCGGISQSACVSVGFMGIASYHAMLLAFSVYLLYRTWIVTLSSKVFLGLAALALFNRAGWALADISLSRNYWDDTYMFCNTSYNTFILTGYLISDTATDLLCTLAILISIKLFSTDLKKVLNILQYENIIRSVFVLAIQSVSVWYTWSEADPAWASIIASLNMYIYTQAINSEFWLYEMKIAAVNEAINNLAIAKMHVNADDNRDTFLKTYPN
ncbi:hypothetical protein HDU98_000620 [Podochytrium sp. JEL0797]|nr:hypothetical protein HDU98_000620 [Podochytrium sp. JEL0797]